MAAVSKPMLSIAGLLGRYRESEAQCGIREHQAAQRLGRIHDVPTVQHPSGCTTAHIIISSCRLLVATAVLQTMYVGMVCSCLQKLCMNAGLSNITPAAGTVQKQRALDVTQHLYHKQLKRLLYSAHPATQSQNPPPSCPMPASCSCIGSHNQASQHRMQVLCSCTLCIPPRALVLLTQTAQPRTALEENRLPYRPRVMQIQVS